MSLFAGTQSGRLLEGRRHERRFQANPHKAKFNADEVREIEQKRNSGKLIKELAYEYQVDRNTLTRALNKKGAYA